MRGVLKAILFDFGGVIAEEGFHQGLSFIGKKNGLDPDEFFLAVEGIIHEDGYVTGIADEATFWNAVRGKTGITGSDAEMREEILKRFVSRPEMISSVDLLRSKGFTVAMLSDQTDWLEEIDRRTDLFRHFDAVFNSFRLHKSKRDASVFGDVCAILGVHPEATLFVDDTIGHIKRAQGQGLKAIHFTGMEEYFKQIMKFVDFG
jgi:putative hydrolase of the HAD superfamily